MTARPSVPWHIVRLWLLLSLATLLAGVLLAPRPTRADEGLNHAGLIVRDAEGRTTFAWVPFGEDEIDGIELLKRSGIPVVTVGFGALGEGVCSIGGRGCGVSECRRTVCQASGADAPYWQYFQQDAEDPARWVWQPLGPSASDVRDGDVFGWSWTANDPDLPALPAAEIAVLAGAGDGEEAEARVRTLLPQGVAAVQPAPAPDVGTTAGAVAMLGVVGGFATGLAGRSRAGAAGQSRPFDPRAWLLWAVAASLPPLLGRNPWPLAATLFAVLGVWGVWSAGAAGARWRPLLRLAVLFGAVSVLFNLLTVHVGDIVVGSLPEHWPVIGGELTLNALIFGLLGAVAIFSLVAMGASLGATLDWSAAMRLLPERMAPLAVAGSVAWSYLPRTTVALSEIREAQMARGYRPRGVRDAAPLVIPLLAGGLERSLTTAEALEARAFGAPLSPELSPHPWQVASLVIGLVAALTGAFCLALGQMRAAAALLIVAVLTIGAGLLNRASVGAWLEAHRPARVPTSPIAMGAGYPPGGGRGVRADRRTRYRDPVWERPEWIVAGSALAALSVQIAVLISEPAAFRYEPYPVLTAPAISLPLLAAIGLLLAPAAVRP